MTNDDEIRVRDTGMKLVVWRGGLKGREFPVEEGANLIGRWDPEVGAFPQVDLEREDRDSKVSRKHALLERNGTSATVTDLGSVNGTYINRGARLVEGTKYVLQPGDELIVGKVFLKLELD